MPRMAKWDPKDVLRILPKTGGRTVEALAWILCPTSMKLAGANSRPIIEKIRMTLKSLIEEGVVKVSAHRHDGTHGALPNLYWRVR